MKLMFFRSILLIAVCFLSTEGFAANRHSSTSLAAASWAADSLENMLQRRVKGVHQSLDGLRVTKSRITGEERVITVPALVADIEVSGVAQRLSIQSGAHPKGIKAIWRNKTREVRLYENGLVVYHRQGNLRKHSRSVIFREADSKLPSEERNRRSLTFVGKRAQPYREALSLDEMNRLLSQLPVKE